MLSLDSCIANVGEKYGNPTYMVHFQQFPLELGSWTPLALKQPLPKRDQDGFVVASVNYVGRDGDRGYITGKQWTADNEIILFGASMQHYGRSNSIAGIGSFCMPVARGTVFQIDFETTSGDPVYSAFWIPMGASHRMSPI